MSYNEQIFTFLNMSERGTIDAVVILKKLQEEYHVKGKKLHMYFVDLVKSLTKYQGK